MKLISARVLSATTAEELNQQLEEALTESREEPEEEFVDIKMAQSEFMLSAILITKGE